MVGVFFSVLFFACYLSVVANNGLPPPWTAYESNGRPYFYNTQTGESTWVRPAVPTQSVAGATPAAGTQYQQPQPQYPYQYQQPQPHQESSLNVQQPQQQPQPQPQPQQQPLPLSPPASGPGNAGNATSSGPRPLNDPETDPGRLVDELRKADHQIDELNDYIDKLLEKIKAGDEERQALIDAAEAAAAANATAAASSGGGADVEALDELSEKIDALQAELADKHDELEGLRAAKEALERDHAAVKVRLEDSASVVKLLRGNLTQQQHECRQHLKRCRDQERELEDCYREIGLLESDLKDVAGKSLRRLTRPSFFARMFDGILATPWQVFGFGAGVGGGRGGGGAAPKSTRTTRRAKGRLAAAQSTQAMNRTIAALRDNLTAMAKSLASKEALVADLSQQLTEKEVEAEKRREAYAVLKDGVDELHGENDRLVADLAAREHDVSSLTAQINRSVDAAAALRKQLEVAEQELRTATDQHHAAADAYEARLAALAVVADTKDGAVAELSAQFRNATETAQRLRDEADQLRAALHTASSRAPPPPSPLSGYDTAGGNGSEARKKKAAVSGRPWYWFLLPWTW